MYAHTFHTLHIWHRNYVMPRSATLIRRFMLPTATPPATIWHTQQCGAAYLQTAPPQAQVPFLKILYKLQQRKEKTFFILQWFHHDVAHETASATSRYAMLQQHDITSASKDTMNNPLKQKKCSLSLSVPLHYNCQFFQLPPHPLRLISRACMHGHGNSQRGLMAMLAALGEGKKRYTVKSILPSQEVLSMILLFSPGTSLYRIPWKFREETKKCKRKNSSK